MFCGSLGDAIKLDRAALTDSMINVTILAVGQGLGTACNTVFLQTFSSLRQKQQKYRFLHAKSHLGLPLLSGRLFDLNV